MAQIQQRSQIHSFTGMNGAGWTAVTVPAASGARRLVIRNNDLADTIEVCTDTADAAAVALIAASGSLALEFRDASGTVQKAKYGETVCYVRGSGDQPVMQWEA